MRDKHWCWTETRPWLQDTQSVFTLQRWPEQRQWGAVMQFNLCGLIQMLLPLRYELDYRPEDNLMEAWELDDCPQYYVWDHVALALHVESGQVRSLRSSRRALLQIQLHRRVNYPLFLFQVLKFDSDRLRQNLKFCERDDMTIAPKFYFDDCEEAQSVIESLWPESSLEKNFAGNKSIKLSVTNLKVIWQKLNST